MADTPDVKQLLLQVDASVELLRRNLTAGDQAVARFQQQTQQRLDATDRRFAQLGNGITGIGAVVARTNAQIQTVTNSASMLERRMSAASASIKATLLASATGVAAAFSVDKVKDYLDGYTRFTNQLKVAGVAGANLATIQSGLFQIAQRTGSPLEAIGTLYGRAAQNGKELGASQADLLRFTGAVGAALKIEGGSAEQAQGALLQLSQALGSGTVHAEEFNSVNEGLRPLLQAAAEASDKYRGSVAQLKNDVIAGKLSSQDFFQLVLAGYDQLQHKAGKANLTIAQSFTVLNNALGKYIGETDAQLSATQRVSGAIVVLADHLDEVLPALAGIAAGFGAMKIGQAAFALIAAGAERAIGVDVQLVRQIALGNAEYVSRSTLAAKAAAATAEESAAEVAAIEAAVVARREDIASLEQTIGLIERQRAAALQAKAAIAANAASGFGSVGVTRSFADADRANSDLKAEMVAKRALGKANEQLAADEALLAAARARSVAATEASAAATAAATVGARASAAASALVAGSLSLIATALPIVVIGALVTAFISMRNAEKEAEENGRAVAARTKELADRAREAHAATVGAATGIASVGNEAAASTGKVANFAGAVGDLANKLRQVAVERQKAAINDAQSRVDAAKTELSGAQSNLVRKRISNTSTFNPLGIFESKTVTDARSRVSAAEANLAKESQSLADARKRALASYIVQSDRTGSRDLNAELDRINVDLLVARRAGLKDQVNDLSAQAFERRRTIALMKTGQSFDAASAQASKEASKLRSAGEERINADASKAAGRSAAKDKTRAAAAVRDEANDARAFSAAERQAQDKIATARADLVDSAALRAQIERDRIEADRVSRNDEIQQQLKAGAFGTGKTATDRAGTLTSLNDRAASAQRAVVDLRERRQVEQDALDVATRGLSIQEQTLQDQAQLATTAIERRAIELRILDLQKQEEKLRLERVLAFDSGASEGDRQQAAIDYNTLDARYAAKGALAVAQTRGPGDQYLASLPHATDEINEAIEGIKVQAIENVGDEVSSLATKFLHLGGVAGQVANSIIASFAKLAFNKYLAPGLGGLLGLKDGGKVDGFADGGLPGFAGGASSRDLSGLISGPGTGRSDSILALLSNGRPIRVSNGEGIVNAAAVRKYWPIIRAMNSGKLDGYADGGLPSTTISTPKIFTPKVPDMKMVAAARAGAAVNQHFDLRGALVDRDVYADINAIATARAREALGAAVDHTNGAIGGLSRPRL